MTARKPAAVYARQCFDLPPDLVEAIDKYCEDRKITKRSFVELAARRMIVAGMKESPK